MRDRDQLPALEGGTPVRPALLPYGRQSLDETDIAAVVDALRSDWLTTGPRVAEFERSFAAVAGVREAAALSSGTAALHAILHALEIGPGDEVIVPAMTFAATANAVLYQGGTPVFADVDPGTLLLDPQDVERRLTSRTRAIVAVDYAGQPCDYDRLRALAGPGGPALVADACHALGGSLRGRPVGSLADLSAFSLHPVKPITTGEGGMVTTDNAAWAERIRRFRSHGITSDHRQRQENGSWFYEMVELGYNYRLTDLQCALGLSQLARLPDLVRRRREIARAYDEGLAQQALVRPLCVRPDVSHGRHLYVVRLALDRLRADRATLFQALRAEGIGVNVHYIPVYRHPYYRDTLGFPAGLCPVAEQAYEEILSLPLFAGMTDEDTQDVLAAIEKIAGYYAR